MKTHSNLFRYLPFHPSMVLTANNPSSRQQRRENPRCCFLLLSVCLKCSKYLFAISPFLCLLSTDLGLLLLYPILFCLFFSISLPLPPPPFLHLFQVQPPVHILMSECSAATQHMHRLTQNVERNIFNHTERVVSDWWAF